MTCDQPDPTQNCDWPECARTWNVIHGSGPGWKRSRRYLLCPDHAATEHWADYTVDSTGECNGARCTCGHTWDEPPSTLNQLREWWQRHVAALTLLIVITMAAVSTLAPGLAAADVELPVLTPVTAALTGSTADRAVAAARTQLGVPYVWGGTTSRGFDCSGLVQWAYRQAGVSLPRTSRAQSRAGTSVSVAQLRAGDLLFYNYGKGVSHVAMAVDSKTVIEAPQPGSRVSTRPLYTRHLVAVRRIG